MPLTLSPLPVLPPPICSVGTNHFFFFLQPNKITGLNSEQTLQVCGQLWGVPCFCTPRGSTSKGTPRLATPLPADLTPPILREAGRARAHAQHHASSRASVLPTELQPQGAHTHVHTLAHPRAHPAPAQGFFASSQVKQHPWSVTLVYTGHAQQRGTVPCTAPQTDRQNSPCALSPFPSRCPQWGCLAPSLPSPVAAQHHPVAADQWPRRHPAGLGSPQAAGWLRGAGVSHTPSHSSCSFASAGWTVSQRRIMSPWEAAPGGPRPSRLQCQDG